jgi:long-chain fatty acid transport protein
VVHHLSGTSKFTGPLADLLNDDEPLVSHRATTNIKLPPYTAVSMYHRINPEWAVMGSVIYTQWNTIESITLNHVAGLVNDPVELVKASTDIEVSIPTKYRNTANLTIGANYSPTETITLRGGIGYDQSPVRDTYRDVRLPDGDRFATAIGAHYQATKTIGLDVGWTHIFMKNTTVNPPPQVYGAETVTTNGRVAGGADVFSGQVTWDIV